MALTDKLRAIGDAIRAKTGKTDALTLDQMPVEIGSIETGPGQSGLIKSTDKTIPIICETPEISLAIYER